MNGVIDLTVSSGDDDDGQRRRVRGHRRILPLPNRKHDKEAIVIISSDDDENCLGSSSAMVSRFGSTNPTSRKGKEVDRRIPAESTRKEGNGSLPRAIPASITKSPLRPTITSIVGFNRSISPRKSNPAVSVPIDPIFGSERFLIQVLNDSRPASEQKLWQYLRCDASSGSNSHVAQFKCSWTGCPLMLLFKDVANNGQRWRRTTLSSERNHHDHSGPRRPVPSDRDISTGQPSLGPDHAPPAINREIRDDGADKRPSTERPPMPRSASPVKVRSSVAKSGPSSTTRGGQVLRQKTLPFVAKPLDDVRRQAAPLLEISNPSQASTSKVANGSSASRSHASPSKSVPHLQARSSDTPTPRNSTRAVREAKLVTTASPTDGAQAGMKRTHQGAFGSHRKRDRTPGVPVIGREYRNRLLDSPGEVSGLIPVDSIPRSPWIPKGSKVDRQKSDASIGGTSSRLDITPTRPSVSRASNSMLNRPSIVGPSSSQPSRLRVPSPLKQTPQTAHATPERLGAQVASNTGDTDNPSTTSKADALNQPASFTTSANARKPSSSQDRNGSHHSGISESSRPKRARPAAGTYTVPSIDAEQWPSIPGSTGKAKQSGSRSLRHETTKVKSSLPGSNGSLLAPSTPRGESARALQPSTSVTRRSRPKPPATTTSAVLDTPTKSLPPIYASQTSSSAHGSRRSARATPSGAHRPPQSSAMSTPRTPGIKGARTPVKPADSPEEEEEMIENKSPTLPARREQEDDLLAEFGTFHFDPVSPLLAMKSMSEGDGTADHEIGEFDRVTPRAGHSQSMPRTPKSQSGMLTSTSKAGPQTPLKPLPQSVKSPMTALSASRLKLGTNKTANSLVADILANATREDAEQKRRMEAKEARDKRMAALLDDDELVDDNLASVSLDAAVADESESQDEESETGQRRSTRLRNDSITAKPKRRPRPRSRARPKATLKTPVRPRPDKMDASHRFFRKQARLEQQGAGFGSAERILRAMRDSAMPAKSDLPYPTPDSDRMSSPGSSDSAPEADVNDHVDAGFLERHEGFDGLFSVVKEARQSGQISVGASGEPNVPQWEGFWLEDTAEPASSPGTRTNKSTTTSTSSATITSHLAAMSAAAPHLSHLFLAQNLEPSLQDQSVHGIISAAVDAVLSEGKAASARASVGAVLHDIRSTTLDSPAVWSSVVSSCSSVWRSLGARPEMCGLADDGLSTASLILPRSAVARRSVCDFLVQVLRGAARCRPSPLEFAKVAPTLLLLAVDPSTSAALRRDIESLLDGCSDEQSSADMIEWARQHDPLPSHIKVQILHVIGTRTSTARSLSRRIATNWLLPETVARANKNEDLNIPSLIIAAESLLHMARQADPPLGTFGDHLTLLYEAMSDVESLLEHTPHEPMGPEDLHPVEHLKALIRKIGQTLRMNGSDAYRLLVSTIKSRLFTLESVLEMQYSTIFKREAQARMASRLENKGLKAGQNGQTVLSLPAAPM